MIKSVNRRLISDVPVGTCLSGGIDSSSIACMINKSKRTEIKTFSAVFPGFQKDESKYINIVSSKTKMKNYKIRPSAVGIKNELFDYIQGVGEPVPSPSPYSQYKVVELAKQNNVTVLLDGQGADELFAGYHVFFGFYIKGLLKKGKIVKALREIFGIFRGGKYHMGILTIGFLFTPFFIREFYFNYKSNISKELLKEKGEKTSFFEKHYKLSSLHKSLEFYLQNKLEQLLKWEDRNSMIHSRESRVPFLDIDVMRFVFQLPEEYIISNGKTKMILRDAMAGIVPDEILQRRDKIGFAVPENEWFREQFLIDLLSDWFINKEPLSKNYINLDKTRKMIKLHINNKKNYGRTFWRIIFLETWLRIYQHKFNTKE
jgi:asparagine synthase (glutamine-hydrolysing)